MKVADFARHEENEIGADWLWWWVSEDSSESFGLLVQAKRLGLTSGQSPTLGLHAKQSSQMKQLIDSAIKFEVPAAYALYFGAVGRRGNLLCRSPEHGDQCSTCQKLTLAIFPASLTTQIPSGSPTSAAREAYARSSPLEDFADPTSTCASLLFGGDGESFTPELRQFLHEDQNGPRQVARKLLHLMIDPELIELSTDVAARPTLPVDAIFRDIPEHRGHSFDPLSHVLGGLRSQPPSYVLDIMADQPPSHEQLGLIGGVVVMRC
jgi:hypothetical protein